MSGSPGWALLAAIGLGTSLVMAMAWLRQQSTKNAGWVDVLWGASLGGAALVLAAGGSGDVTRRGAFAAVAASWSARLSIHLARRVSREVEDGRYRRLREQWGASSGRNFFLFFQAQALFVAFFALAWIPVVGNRRPFGSATDFAALAVAIVAVGGEALADRQLARFRAAAANRGRTCRDGLWRWSRHPNYFFEWLHWFAYVLLAIGGPWAPLSLLGPVAMLLFLFRLTGIPHTEAQAIASRGDDYRRYQQSTSPFFPWPPRSENAR